MPANPMPPPATPAPDPTSSPHPPTPPTPKLTMSPPPAEAETAAINSTESLQDTADAAAAAMANALAQVWSAHATLAHLVKASPESPLPSTTATGGVDRNQAVRALDAIHLLLETVVTPHVVAVAESAVAAVDVDVAADEELLEDQIESELDGQDGDGNDRALVAEDDLVAATPVVDDDLVAAEAEDQLAPTPAESVMQTNKHDNDDDDDDDDTHFAPPQQPLDSLVTAKAAEDHHQHVAPAAVDELAATHHHQGEHAPSSPPTSSVAVAVDASTVDHHAHHHIHSAAAAAAPALEGQDDPLLRKRSTKLRRSSTRRRNSDVRRTLVMMDLSLDRHLASLDPPEVGKQDDSKSSALAKLTAKAEAPSVEQAVVVQVDKKEDSVVQEAEDEETDHSGGYLHILDPTDEYDLDDSIALAPPPAALDSPPPLPAAPLAPPTTNATQGPQTPPSPASTASPAPHDLDHDHDRDLDARPPTQPHSPPSSPNPTHPPLHLLTGAAADGAPRPLTSPAHVTASLASTHHTDAAVDEARAVVSEYAEAATRTVLMRAEHEATMVAAAAVVAGGSEREEKRRSLVASVASAGHGASPRQSLVGGPGRNLPPMMSSSAASVPVVEAPPVPQLARAATAPADPGASSSSSQQQHPAARPPSASPPSKSVGFASTVSVVSPPADSPPNPALAASSKPASGGSAKRAMHALRKAIQNATTTAASAARRSRSTSPKNAARTPYPDHPQPMLAAGAVDLSRNESTLSRRIHEADANMVRNAQIIAMAARAEEERQRTRARAQPQPQVWDAEPAAAAGGQQQAVQQPPQPKRRSSATAPDVSMPAKQAMDVLAGATPAPDRFLPPSVAEQQRWSRSTISAADAAQQQQQPHQSSTPIATTDRTLAPIPARSTSAASTTSSGPTPSARSRASSSSSSAHSDDSLPELWPLVELSPDRQLSLRHRAALLTASIARDAIGYYASNEPREKWAHAHACRAAFLARHAAPTVQMLHTAGMKVTLAQLVHALEWVASGKGARRERMPPAPVLPEVPTPDVLQRVQRTLLGFVASFTDVGPADGAVNAAGSGGMPAAIKVAGLASALFASPVVNAAAARFATSHPVVFRMLDRITALLVLARLTGLSLLYPVPGAGFAGEAMVRAVPRGTRVPTSEMLRVGGAGGEGDVDVEEPLPSGCEVPEGFKVYDGEEGDEEENVAVGVAAANKRQQDEESRDCVDMLVFPGLVDAQGRVVSKAWVLVE